MLKRAVAAPAQEAARQSVHGEQCAAARDRLSVKPPPPPPPTVARYGTPESGGLCVRVCACVCARVCKCARPRRPCFSFFSFFLYFLF